MDFNPKPTIANLNANVERTKIKFFSPFFPSSPSYLFLFQFSCLFYMKTCDTFYLFVILYLAVFSKQNTNQSNESSLSSNQFSYFSYHLHIFNALTYLIRFIIKRQFCLWRKSLTHFLCIFWFYV